ncbi:Endoplasmic reticulum membrane protein [Lachnellula occidentalis]|uniref:Endoplasmic reticulum membrane protein n=1 Tax=Lachnellula occidentalis TaxID=215460 RepID=A0A8H8S4E3_9HELO|nr:Endoplasmic reticulum membrane protein [Lachnellula occidentalis]
MPMSVEDDSRSQEGARPRHGLLEDHAVLSVTDSDGSHQQYQYRHVSPSPITHLAVKETRQLASPSPTPSPRRLSSSSVVTTDSFGELDTSSSIPNLHSYSGILEKPSHDSASGGNGEVMYPSPLPISTTLPPHELHDIPEERVKKPRKLSTASPNGEILKLSAAEMEELTSAPDSLPVTSPVKPLLAASPMFDRKGSMSDTTHSDSGDQTKMEQVYRPSTSETFKMYTESNGKRRPSNENTPSNVAGRRPGLLSSRTISTPVTNSNRMPSYSKDSARQPSPRRKPTPRGARLEPLDIKSSSKPLLNNLNGSADHPTSPIPPSIPLPPMSIPTYLQLELSSSRPSPLYIYQSPTGDTPYESSKIKFERLLNFLLLPPQLEQVIFFGSLACLDAWLYTFTILPLRFFKAAAILIQWWGEVLSKEARFILGFIYHGAGRFWHRQRDRNGSSESSSRSRSVSRARHPITSKTSSFQSQYARASDSSNGHGSHEQFMSELERKSRQGWGRKHRRTKSHPSSLSSNHKADLIQGAVIICTCILLMKLDASRMYHNIRGQSAIKLYVIYNALEVCDKLFSALGQDIFECLFSNETLERDPDGRSKVLRPLGMFVLALIYNVIHAGALFCQVITLNVAVNSYSNALLTLLISNQFVEVKSTVFKMFQKDNLFQLTCADVVERFQLWLMLIIIALRNIVELGGLSIVGNEGDLAKDTTTPIRTNSILPHSFTILPSWSGEVLTPFLLVLGSEMLVDWVKHAYISKFNRVKPALYQKYLDVLAKDYYSNAFVNQNLVKRLGLPVIPLSCLFIRSSVQTYHMFLATHVSTPVPSTATALSVESATASPATMAALEHFDNIIRNALGRSTFGIPHPESLNRWYLPSADDAIAALTMLIFFLGAFLVLLACKLVLGMLLLKFARNRYQTMKTREHQNYDMDGKRIGGWGMVELEEEKRRYFFEDDPETLKKLKEKERLAKEKAAAGQDFSKISRYEMSAKRIW